MNALAVEVDKNFGRCDILVNNAGIFKLQPFEEMTFADWRRTLSINLDSAFLTCAAFAPGMKQRGWGRIVNMASSTFSTVTSGFSHYVASKGGVIGLTHVLATELGPHGVTVNAIAPALTRTPGAMARGPRPGETDMEKSFAAAASRQAIRARAGAGRSGRHRLVPDQRRRGLHHRPDAARERRAAALVVQKHLLRTNARRAGRRSRSP